MCELTYHFLYMVISIVIYYAYRFFPYSSLPRLQLLPKAAYSSRLQISPTDAAYSCPRIYTCARARMRERVRMRMPAYNNARVYIYKYFDGVPRRSESGTESRPHPVTASRPRSARSPSHKDRDKRRRASGRTAGALSRKFSPLAGFCCSVGVFIPPRPFPRRIA